MNNEHTQRLPLELEEEAAEDEDDQFPTDSHHHHLTINSEAPTVADDED
jgi:hypothetical protein